MIRDGFFVLLEGFRPELHLESAVCLHVDRGGVCCMIRHKQALEAIEEEHRKAHEAICTQTWPLTSRATCDV